jgi:hypothetical protein
MGYLVIKSGFIPKVIGYFLLIAGVGYLMDFTFFFLFPDIPVKVSSFTFVGEVLLLFWLLAMGVDVEQWKKQALAAAAL